MRGLLVGLIVPHAPVLVPQLRGGEPAQPQIRSADDEPLCIVLSPHGRAPGVYRRARGDLAGFGVRDVGAERRTDRVAGKQLARAWGEPLLEAPLDHGVVVPMLVALPPTLTVVGATLQEVTGPDAGDVAGAIKTATRFAEAIRALGEERDLIFAASAHGSAALSPQAPLTDRPAGHELAQRIGRALEEDLGLLAEIEVDLWSEGGACGAGPLTAFGILFAGRTASVTFREAPFGVDYLLAQVA